jgi:long-subunit acyl-CoA synthetase (AMP-forming)
MKVSWSTRFREWRGYRAVLSRLREITRKDPQVKAADVSAADLEWISRGKHAADLMARACQRYGSRACVAEREEGADYLSTSYSELWNRALSLASGLQARELVDRGDLVGLCGAGSAAWVAADLACLALGAVSVPLDSNIHAEDLSHIVGETGLTVLVADYGRYTACATPCASAASRLCSPSRLGASVQPRSISNAPGIGSMR